MSDYKILDQYEGDFDRNVAHADKTFGHPVDNDPLHIVEQHIQSPHILRPQNPVIEPPDDYYKVPRSDPIPPPRQDFRPGGFRNPDAPRPDVLQGEHHAWWREPRIPPLRGTPGKSTDRKPNLSSYHPRGHVNRPYLVECPKRDGNFVTKSTCRKCEHYDSKAVQYDYCTLKKKEAKRVSGKG